MLITLLKSKIHRAKVTAADLNYVGSITIDSELMALADLLPWEKVMVADISNGERFETYVIEGEKGSGIIALNGAAAHKGAVGDLVIILSFGHIEKDQARDFKPVVVHVDNNNRPVK